MSALTDAMQEYANAIRRDWLDFDGRSERDVIERWVAEIKDPTLKSLAQWRDELGLCPDGNGHWAGLKWGNCHRDNCPTQVAREEEQ